MFWVENRRSACLNGAEGFSNEKAYLLACRIRDRVDRANDGSFGRYGKRKFILLKDEIKANSLDSRLLIDSGVRYFENWYLQISSSVITSPVYFYKRQKGEKIAGSATAICWKELDWSRSSGSNPYAVDGLLTSNGEWIGCGYGRHYEVETVLLGGSGDYFEESEKIVHFSKGFHDVEFKLTGPQVRFLRGIRDRFDKLWGNLSDPLLKAEFFRNSQELIDDCGRLLRYNERKFGASPSISLESTTGIWNYETSLQKLPRSGD